MTITDKNTLKDSIIEYSLKKKKRQVYIKCPNNSTGKLVANILSSNKLELLPNGHGWKKIREGFGYKDFTIIFHLQDDSEEFYNNLDKVMNGVHQVESPETVNEEVNSYGGSGNTLMIVAGIILLLSVGIVLWTKSK